MDKPWAIYFRVSTRQQVDGFSLDEQRETLVASAESQGWAWKLFEDPGVSGESLDRPGLLALLEAADQGDISGVLVLDESRLARSDRVAATIRDRLARAGAPLAMPGRGIMDLTDPNMLFTTQVLANAASLEQNLRTQKMKAGLRRAAQAGYWPGGPAPYGYQLAPSDDGKHTVLNLNEDEAEVLRLVANLIVHNGYTTYSAAAYLNASGIRTRHERPWRHTNLSWQLRQRRTTGDFIYQSADEHIPISIPAVFAQDEWIALQKAIKGKPRPHRKNRLYPLTGRGRVHLRCACGGNFYGFSDRSNKKGPMYECSRNDQSFGAERCPHRPRLTRADTLETAIWDQIVAAIADEGYLETLIGSYLADASDGDHQQRLGHLRKRLADLQGEETRIVRHLAEDDGLHGDALTRALGETTADRLTVEKELERIQETQQAALTMDSVPEAARRLSLIAKARLTNPTVELMADVFDLLQVDLIRVEGRSFEGVARLPLPDPQTEGEVWVEALLPRGPRRPRCGPVSGGGHDGAGSSRSPHLPLLRSVGEPPSEPHDRSGGARQHLRRSRCAHRLLFPATAH